MLGDTSTSASAAATASPEDLSWSKTAGRISGDLSAPPNNAQTFHFTSGNPGIEETRGLMHLYREDASSSSSSLPVERNPLICVLGVPNHMTYSDFCEFVGSFIQHMSEMRIVRTEGLKDRYSILIRLHDQDSADSFFKHFNDKCFSSLEEETCQVFFTSDIQYTGSIEHSQASTESSVEQPSCPVCLEKLNQCSGGILTTICNHSFHLSCISRWTYSSCPACRYCLQQPEKSICYVCQTSDNLWRCVICGFVGCGRYKDGHAVRHWKETQHCYSLELETQRFWDYVGDRSVHRLIQSKTDGKLVELNSHCTRKDGECGDSIGFSDTLPYSEIESAIVNEYRELLTTQLENQKNYFESLLQEIEEDTAAAVENALSQNSKLQKLQAKLDKLSKEKKFMDDINDNLLRNQSIRESKINNIEEREKKLVKLKDTMIKELEEQLRIMIESLEVEEQKSTEQHPSTSTELKDESVHPPINSPTTEGDTKMATSGENKE